MTRLAALDLGSNSFHLLVADTRPRGRIKRVTTRKKTIRLGEPVSRTGRLGSEAFGRAETARLRRSSCRRLLMRRDCFRMVHEQMNRVRETAMVSETRTAR